MIRLAVFDWNGTLLADATAVVEGVNKELEVLGQPPITLATYRQLYEIPTVNFYQKLGVPAAEFKAKSPAMAKVFHEYYEPRAARARTRHGARELLDHLARKGVTRVILSNHTLEGIYFQLERLGLTHHFEAVLANEAIGMGHFKGKRERLVDYLHETGVDPAKAAIVGDTVEEVKIGKELGMKTIAITGGYNATNRLRQAKPDALVTSLLQIKEAVEEV